LELKFFCPMAKKLNFYIFIAEFGISLNLDLKKKCCKYPLSLWSGLFIISNRIQKVVVVISSFNSFRDMTIHRCDFLQFEFFYGITHFNYLSTDSKFFCQNHYSTHFLMWGGLMIHITQKNSGINFRVVVFMTANF